MPISEEKNRVAPRQGTLELSIPRILVFGPEHGQRIARAVRLNSEDVSPVDHGAPYPALQRLEAQEVDRLRAEGMSEDEAYHAGRRIGFTRRAGGCGRSIRCRMRGMRRGG